MTDQKKILILIDGSERSMQTLDYVGSLTPFKKFKLVLFHVFSGVPECYWDMERTPQNQHAISQLRAWESQRKKEIDSFAQNARQTLINGGFSKDSVELKIQKRQNGVARDILKEAQEGNYTAVVLRRRGVGALEGMVVGSIANKLFSKLTFCPLIIAGRHPAREKLLIAIDGSPSSMQAVDFVTGNFDGQNYSVGLIYVIRGFGSLVPDNPEFLMPAENVELAHNEMMELFADVKAKFIKAGFEENKISERIITGVYSRAGAIVQEAEAGGYGTIVIGRKGLSKVREFFMGRVCNKVIHCGSQFSVWVI
ncbi:MAG: universal stress protein [Desulfobacteraceae bacterium]|jgi:nucleotide-binding universal stress UspA family protein|nr:universal stress protein [Desulfobacteraceae bacterium]